MSLIDRHSSPATWMTATHGFASPVANIGAPQGPRYHSASRTPPDAGLAPIPPQNEQELTRNALLQVLDHFSQLVVQHFSGRPIRLVVHGGACMLLHEGLYKLSLQQHHMSPSLPRRTTTRDVDYIHRSFVPELAAAGVHDAAARLAECIKGTARKFGLGLDWMNSHADVALPYAFDPAGKPYDPIYNASIQQNNIDLHTVYTSPNKSLTLISVTPFWAVSLKLSRYVRWDPGDICLLLRNGVVLSGTHWTPEQLENWLYTQCWATGYSHFDSIKKQQLKERILHAINQLKIWNEAVGISSDRGQSSRKRERDKENQASVLPLSMAWGGRTVSAHDAMGGGEVVGGGDGALSSGWTPATGQWPTRDQVLRSTPPNWNVVDWANGKLSPPGGAASGSDREKKSDRGSRRGSSKSRAPSRAASGHEIFIPDSGDEGDGWKNDTGGSYPSVPGQQWAYLNPNHAPNTRPPSRQRSPDPYNGIYGPPPLGKGLDDMASTLGGPLNALDYGPAHDSRSGHRRTQSHVVPTSSYNHDYHDPEHDRKGAALRYAQAEKMRKKKEKERKRTKEIEKARSSKWGPRHWLAEEAPAESGSERDDTDEESDESTDEERHVDNDRRARNGKSRANGKRSGHRHHDQLHEANGWHGHGSYGVPHAATPGAASLHPPVHFSASSRPASRNASPGRTKKRPPPLPISPSPAIVSSAPSHRTTHARSGHASVSAAAVVPPARLGAAERAQYQFEQQQRDYHQQLVKQSHQPSVKEVANRVAEQMAAQQASTHFHAHSHSQAAQAQQQHQQQQQAEQHAQRLRGAASWAQPMVVNNNSNNHHSHSQSWYTHPQQHQQYHQPTQRLRQAMTEIYH